MYCTHLSAQVPGLFGHLVNGWVQWVTFLFPASLWKETKTERKKKKHQLKQIVFDYQQRTMNFTVFSQ